MLATPMTAGASAKPPILDHPIAGMAFSQHVTHYMHEKKGNTLSESVTLKAPKELLY
mgnify:FL=1